jgi:CubicO group peptidase (beta-lactamase class C family)
MVAGTETVRLDRRQLIRRSAMTAMSTMAAPALPVTAIARTQETPMLHQNPARQGTPTSRAGGQDQSRWARVHDVMAGFVEQGAFPGLVTLIAQGDDVHVDAIGTLTIDGTEPMRRDTIFRIASMTKPITAAATMILVEDGTIALDEPVDRLLPELADRRVLKRLDGPVDDTVPAVRSITVRDLLTFVLGFGLVFDPSLPIVQAAADQGFIIGPPQPQEPPPPNEWIQRFASLPLMFQPGELWLYNAGTEILGVLIARAAKQPFDTFLHERIFTPLGMSDTGFYVPADKLDRFATSYWPNPETGAVEVLDSVADSQWGRPPAFPSGSAGLVSTVDDFLVFARMLLNEGTHGDTALLTSDTIAQMTTDQLTPAQKTVPAGNFDVRDGRGWGFGMAVVTAPDELSAVPGRYGWDGGLGTTWLNDPNAGLIAMAMTQSADFLFTDALPAFWSAVYEALDA